MEGAGFWEGWERALGPKPVEQCCAVCRAVPWASTSTGTATWTPGALTAGPTTLSSCRSGPTTSGAAPTAHLLRARFSSACPPVAARADHPSQNSGCPLCVGGGPKGRRRWSQLHDPQHRFHPASLLSPTPSTPHPLLLLGPLPQPLLPHPASSTSLHCTGGFLFYFSLKVLSKNLQKSIEKFKD